MDPTFWPLIEYANKSTEGKNQDGRCLKPPSFGLKWPNTLRKLSLFLVATINPTWMKRFQDQAFFWSFGVRHAVTPHCHVSLWIRRSLVHINMALHKHHGRTWDQFRHSVYFLDIWGLKSQFIHWRNHPLNAGWGIKLPLMFSGLQTGLTTIVIFVA